MPEIDTRAIKAAAGLYHSYFTGLILTLVTRRGAPEAAEWVFRLFRHQHHEKFLSSFDKLGLRGMPDAVACAAFHYLSNQIGGVEVEFMRESERKAWVNFVPPRWIYPGASICAVPSEVSRAFLRGLVRAQWRLPRQPPPRLCLYRPDHGRAAWPFRLLPGPRPRTR